MKITICALLLLAGTAFADNKLQLSRVGPAEPAPTIASSVSKCASNEHTRWIEVKLDARKVELLHECGSADAHAKLAFEAKDGKGVHVYTSAVLDKIQWPPEVMTIGKLKGGKKALLHRVDLRIEDQATSRIDVCTFDSDGMPKCGHAEVTCPETGCKPPEIMKGALWIHAKDGRKRYVIE
ncbi:MAG TPA: hypothetical protein VLB44_03320 [Kofleriaceae bacterium]|nr:hypothetical protein [Kofleriaceae bacterium]